MQLIGQAVKHSAFGKGVVTGRDDGTITICFPAGEKKFLYPDAFSKFLTLKNDDLQAQVRGLLQQQEAQRDARQRAVQEKQDRKNLLRTLKISPHGQAVFDIRPGEQEHLFSAWSVSTGRYISGYFKGEPRIPDRLKPNSMCLLTQRPAGQPERERRIIGAFMVEADFLGCWCRDGIVAAHPDYRLRLPTGCQPLFWPYVTREPGAQRWGRTALKYLSNQTGEQILFELKPLLRGSAEEQAERFYQYYCKLNRLPPRKAVPADGSIQVGSRTLT